MTETYPSDAPLRAPGTRTRSGNAMLRTRGAILDAAARCVERYGVRKTTMSDVATQASVAKATLYNHFRTKDDVLAALATARVEQLATDCAATARAAGLSAALVQAATAVGGSGALRRVAADEPAVLARIAAPGTGRTWDAVRSSVEGVLVASGAPTAAPGCDLVLRWLLAQAVWPGTVEEVALGAQAVSSAVLSQPVLVSLPADPPVLPPVAAPTGPPVPGSGPVDHAGSPPAAAGLGWPR